MFTDTFQTLFGLAAKAPGCATEAQKTAIETSDSGLFLDQMDELNLKTVPSAADCINGVLHPQSIYALMLNARNSALQALESDLLTGLSTINKLKTDPYTGTLGDTGTRGTLLLDDGQTVTTRIKTNNLPGNVLRIKTLGLHTTQDTVVPVTINGATYEVQTSAAGLTSNIIGPLDIPLDGQDMVISYVVNGFLVKDNKMCYGCAGTARKITPYLPTITTQEGNGLVIGVSFFCQADNIIYRSYESSPAVQRVMAYSSRFKTAELLIERILNSNEINRYTMMGNEYLWGKRNHFRKEYQDRVNWLVSEDGFDLAGDTCYTCKSVSGFRKRGILI